MEIEIIKNLFLDIDKINNLKKYVYKLNNKIINNKSITADIELDISYRDIDDNECFKSIPFSIELDIDELNVNDFMIKSINVFVVEAKGISLECLFSVSYSDITKEIEIINIDSPKKEEIVSVKNEENESIEKIKADLAQDYENKLADNLKTRDNNIAIISTKAKNNDVDFLRFFDENISNYYSIKTLECNSEEKLNNIAKEYKISINTLLAGYDRENGKVTFKLDR